MQPLDVSVGEIVAGLLPNPPRLIAVLFAYLDETGTNGTPTATIVGGVVGLLPQIVQAEGRWRARVQQDGIKAFHATKCRGGHGEYHAWRPDWDRMKRHYSDLATIAGKYELRPVSGSVLFADWNALEDSAIKQRFPSTYAFCFELCLFHIQRVAKELGETAMVFYAVSQQYADRAAEVARAYTANKQWFDRIVSCAPAASNDIVPLQIADMAAYEMYHLFHSQGTAKRPDLELMPLLGDPMKPNGFFYDAEALRMLSAAGPLGMV